MLCSDRAIFFAAALSIAPLHAMSQQRNNLRINLRIGVAPLNVENERQALLALSR